MKNLNAEEIIKALEKLGTDEPNPCPYCPSCPALNYALRVVEELTEDKAIQVITAIELDKQVERLTEENEDLNAQCRYYAEAYHSVKADTIEDIRLRFAMRFGTYTDKDMTPITEVFRLLDQIAKRYRKRGDTIA